MKNGTLQTENCTLKYARQPRTSYVDRHPAHANAGLCSESWYHLRLHRRRSDVVQWLPVAATCRHIGER